MSKFERKAMIGPREDLSFRRQCQLAQISRSTLYYQAPGKSAETLELMRQIDRLYMQYPFYGARQMVRYLRREG